MQIRSLRERAPSARLRSAAIALAMTAAVAGAQNPISWSVADIVDRTDVSTRGEPVLAVNLGPEVCERVVNGVHFQADRSHWTTKTLVRGWNPVRGVMHFPAWSTGGVTLSMPYNRTAGNIGARHATDADYDAILRDGRHSSPGTQSVTCTISGLVPGMQYEIQLFYGNAGRPTRITEWDDGVGGAVGAGGIFMRPTGTHFGQVATGTFTATGNGLQTLTNFQHPANGSIPETHNACSAFQLRQLTPGTFVPRVTHYGEGTAGTDTGLLLGGTSCSPGINLEGAPRLATTVLLTAENSQDLASVGAVVVGLAPLSFPFLGGTLLVGPVDSLPVPIPQPANPYVHDHELQLPLRVPNTPSSAAIYLQVLQVDPEAPGGVSMTPGLKVEIGI